MRYPAPVEDRERAEALLLGSLLLDPAKGASVQTLLQPQDFTENHHRLIYETLLTVFTMPLTSELDAVQAMGILLTPEELERMGNTSYLMTLKQQAKSTTVPLEDQAYLLKQATLYCLLVEMKEVLQRRNVQDDDALKHLMSDLEQASTMAQQLFSAQNHVPLIASAFQSDLDVYISDLDTRRRQNRTPSGIPTGFIDVDRLTGGLQQSDLILIAGPPSCGKTSFALSIALHVLLQQQRSIGLFSLEAPTKRVIEHLLSMEAHLDQQCLRWLELDDEEWMCLGKASATLSEAKLWIEDTPHLTTAHLHKKAHVLVEQYGVELLIVDYVHLMTSTINNKRHEDRVQEIGEISRSLKALARDLAIPILALAQVSRAFEGRQSKKLQPSDLRDGSLENDADLVLFLSLDKPETSGPSNRQLATVSIAKHRNGPCADVHVCFEPRSTRFCDLQTLAPSSAPQHPSVSSEQPRVSVGRLQDIMARAQKRRQEQEKL